MYLLLEFQSGTAPRHVDFFRPLSSATETGASYVFDFNWKWMKTLIWWLNECSDFAKLSLRVKIPTGQRVTGRSERGSAGPVSALPAVFTGSPVAVHCSTPIWYWAVPIPKEEMPFFSMALFAKYPSILLWAWKSQFLQQWRTGRSQGEIRWRLRWPQTQPLMETKKSSNTCTVPGLQAGWHKLMQTPGLSLFQLHAWIEWFAHLLVLPECSA